MAQKDRGSMNADSDQVLAMMQQQYNSERQGGKKLQGDFLTRNDSRQARSNAF